MTLSGKAFKSSPLNFSRLGNATEVFDYSIKRKFQGRSNKHIIQKLIIKFKPHEIKSAENPNIFKKLITDYNCITCK